MCQGLFPFQGELFEITHVTAEQYSKNRMTRSKCEIE